MKYLDGEGVVGDGDVEGEWLYLVLDPVTLVHGKLGGEGRREGVKDNGEEWKKRKVEVEKGERELEKKERKRKWWKKGKKDGNRGGK